MVEKFKEKLNRFFYGISVRGRILKMRLLWLFTRNRKHPVAEYKTINEIPETLKWGGLYKFDPPNRDPVYHPTKIQCSLDKGYKIGDCDDHAIYWCAALIKNKLVKKAWICIFFYIKADTTFAGHAICVFQGHDGKMYWGDYSTPTPVEFESSVLPTRFNWLLTAMQKYGAIRITSAMMFNVKRLNWRDTPILRKPEYIGKRTLEEIINNEE